MAKAIVLLSGGLDSALTLGIALEANLECYPLFFDYGQRNKCEKVSAARIVSHYAKLGKPCRTLRIMRLDLPFATSALTSSELDVTEETKPGLIPRTYVPARNTMFLSIAGAFAEDVGARYIYIGICKSQDNGAFYPDCCADFIEAMEHVLSLGTRIGEEGIPLSILSPLVDCTKTDILRLALEKNVPVRSTWSCYQPIVRSRLEKPCGVCDACKVRASAFAELGVEDAQP